MWKTGIEAFSGLGLLLFGMLYLEHQIRLAAGHTFRSWIRRTTGTRAKSFLSGFFATVIFQSSSVVTLMALSLTGTGLMDLEAAIATIFGANLGTTVTAWIVGLVGFKMDIKLLSYAFIGIGGLGSVLMEDGSRARAVLNGMVGFGLIFLGLEGMKESFSIFAEHVDLAKMGLSNPLEYMAVGFAITSLIQSSSASIAIAQSALFAHIIGFESAAAFVIGANVGTTVTAMLGAIGGSADKKRTAMAHLLFNLSTGVVALILLKPLMTVTAWAMPHTEPVIRLALFHTLFNLIGIVLWYPFTASLAYWLKRFFKKERAHVTHYLHNVSAQIPDVAIEALEKEILHLAEEVESFSLLAIGIPPTKALEKGVSVNKLLDKYTELNDLSFERHYAHMRRLEGEILRFIAHLAAEGSDVSFQRRLDRYAHITTYLATAAKAIKDILHDLQRWYDAPQAEERQFLRNLRYQIIRSLQAFHQAFVLEDEQATEELERWYRQIAHSYKDTVAIISSLAKNRDVPSEMTTIAINDLHLSKSFSKSLRNVLKG